MSNNSPKLIQPMLAKDTYCGTTWFLSSPDYHTALFVQDGAELLPGSGPRRNGCQEILLGCITNFQQPHCTLTQVNHLLWT